MKFRTEVKAIRSEWGIKHRDYVFCLGSCFSTEIAEKLNFYKFNVLNNPFGTLFHPVALANCLSRIYMNEQYEESEISHCNHKYFSFDHSTQFTSAKKEETLNSINKQISLGNEFFQKANTFIITLGTAWVYGLSDGFLVANCHKIPQNVFNKRLLNLAEIEESLRAMVNMLLDAKNNPRIIFTISPVRHLRDGLIENNQSKSLLNVALQNILNEFKFATYFPSYEYVTDELRDYRFFKPDMAHPTDQAIDYVWENFADTFFSSSTKEIMNEIHKIKNNIAHKSLSPQSIENKLRLRKLKDSVDKMAKSIPYLDFSQEYKTFKECKNEDS